MHPKKLIYAVLFSLYMLEFQMFMYIEGTIDGVLSVKHYVTWMLVSLGFISFWILRSVISDTGRRQRVIMLINSAFFASVCLLVLTESTLLKGVTVMLAGLFIGCLGAAIYFFCACEYCMNRHLGLIMAVSTSVPYIIQYMFTPVFKNAYVQIITMLLLFSVVSYIAMRHPRDYILEDMLPYIKETSDYKSELNNEKKKTVIFFFIMLVIGVYMEQTWSSGALSGDVNMYGIPRLFVILGYFYAGFFTDYKERRYLEISALLAFSFFGLATYSTDGAYLRLIFFYFIAGVYTGYLNAAFWYLAPRTEKPELWACLGRVLSFFEGVFGIAFMHIEAGSMLQTFIECFFILIIVFATYRLAINYRTASYVYDAYVAKFDLNIKENTNVSDEKGAFIMGSDNDPKMKFERYCTDHAFTPRERDVMKMLLSSDESMKIIAEKLSISERMLYRYMNSLYGKTETQTRASLLKSYYKFRISDDTL